MTSSKTNIGGEAESTNVDVAKTTILLTTIITQMGTVTVLRLTMYPVWMECNAVEMR